MAVKSCTKDNRCMIINTLQLPSGDGCSTGKKCSEQGALVYFYCKRDEPDRQDPTKIMQSLVRQLSVQLPGYGIPKPVTDEYEKREKNAFSSRHLSFQECQKLIVSLLDIYPQTTIAIDALDEADRKSRKPFLEALNTIAQASKNLVKIFVSSRDDDDIILELKAVPNLYIDAADNAGDIERFILREINSCIDRRILLRGEVEDQLKRQIISALVAKADGM
jgi:hypothetical protein